MKYSRIFNRISLAATVGNVKNTAMISHIASEPQPKIRHFLFGTCESIINHEAELKIGIHESNRYRFFSSFDSCLFIAQSHPVPDWSVSSPPLHSIHL